MIPEIGYTFKFIPSAYAFGDNGTDVARERLEKQRVIGTVTGIHYKHHWYRVSYQTKYSGIQHECFHFYGRSYRDVQGQKSAC